MSERITKNKFISKKFFQKFSKKILKKCINFIFFLKLQKYPQSIKNFFLNLLSFKSLKKPPKKYIHRLKCINSFKKSSFLLRSSPVPCDPRPVFSSPPVQCPSKTFETSVFPLTSTRARQPLRSEFSTTVVVSMRSTR